MARWRFLGRTEYRSCWALQRQLWEERCAGQIEDTLLLTEHDPVYTIGKSGNPLHLLADEAELQRRNIELVETDRGGDITYHGPGQLVTYPILALAVPDVHAYLRSLEEAVIRTLALYGLEAGRVEGYTGVWLGGEKICAIGVKARSGVTMHGCALNVSTDLRAFGRIIPCGIFERGVTSMEEHLGSRIPLEEVAATFASRFGDVFGCSMIEGEIDAGWSVPGGTWSGART